MKALSLAEPKLAVALMAKRRQAMNAHLYRAALERKAAGREGLQVSRRASTRRRSAPSSARSAASTWSRSTRSWSSWTCGRCPGPRLRAGSRCWSSSTAAGKRGEAISVPLSVIQQAGTTDVRNLTFEQLQGLVDTVRQIDHLARVKGKLMLLGEQRRLVEIDVANAASIFDANGGTPPILRRHHRGREHQHRGGLRAGRVPQRLQPGARSRRRGRGRRGVVVGGEADPGSHGHDRAGAAGDAGTAGRGVLEALHPRRAARPARGAYQGARRQLVVARADPRPGWQPRQPRQHGGDLRPAPREDDARAGDRPPGEDGRPRLARRPGSGCRVRDRLAAGRSAREGKDRAGAGAGRVLSVRGADLRRPDADHAGLVLAAGGRDPRRPRRRPLHAGGGRGRLRVDEARQERPRADPQWLGDRACRLRRPGGEARTVGGADQAAREPARRPPRARR